MWGYKILEGGGTAILGGVFGAREVRAIFLPPQKNLYPGVQIFWGGGYFTKKYLHFNILQKQSLKGTIYANQIIYA